MIQYNLCRLLIPQVHLGIYSTVMKLYIFTCILLMHIYMCTILPLCTFYSFFYNVFISQLFYDGHQQLAVQLSNLVKAHPACPPSDRLFKVVKFGLESEEGEFYDLFT